MYEQHYGITAKPFQLTPDAKFFFASDKHQQALSYLKYGLEQGEGFIVITGPIGTGKTTLAQNLLTHIENTNVEAIQIVTSKLSPEDLLAVIANEFGIATPVSNKAQLLKTIEQHLISLSKQQKRALLIVDEAQNLPADTVEELRMLSNFQINNKPLLQSFLLGQEELKAIIQSPAMEQFRQRIIASCHLKPLALTEIVQYISHRLSLVNIPDVNIFSTDCYPLIESQTLGVPRKINLLMDRILLYGFLNDIKKFGLEDVKSVILELAEELSSTIHLENEQATTVTNATPVDDQDRLQHSAIINASILEKIKIIDEFLQENVAQKIKMNRYLDKVSKQKKLALAQAEEEFIKTQNIIIAESEAHILATKNEAMAEAEEYLRQIKDKK